MHVACHKPFKLPRGIGVFAAKAGKAAALPPGRFAKRRRNEPVAWSALYKTADCSDREPSGMRVFVKNAPTEQEAGIAS